MPPIPSIVTRAELTAVIERDRDGYVALCPEVDVASQGNTIHEARKNLEAVTLFFETASDSELKSRIRSDVYVTRIQVPVRVTQPSAKG